MTTRVANNPGLGVFAPMVVGTQAATVHATLTPATAEAHDTALAQNLNQTQVPAVAKKTSGWWIAALAGGALIFL